MCTNICMKDGCVKSHAFLLNELKQPCLIIDQVHFVSMETTCKDITFLTSATISEQDGVHNGIWSATQCLMFSAVYC